MPARLDKGSHIVVRRSFQHDRGYIFRTSDRRFVLRRCSTAIYLIGTTIATGDPAGSKPGADEIVTPAGRPTSISAAIGRGGVPAAITYDDGAAGRDP